MSPHLTSIHLRLAQRGEEQTEWWQSLINYSAEMLVRQEAGEAMKSKTITMAQVLPFPLCLSSPFALLLLLLPLHLHLPQPVRILVTDLLALLCPEFELLDLFCVHDECAEGGLMTCSTSLNCQYARYVRLQAEDDVLFPGHEEAVPSYRIGQVERGLSGEPGSRVAHWS